MKWAFFVGSHGPNLNFLQPLYTFTLYWHCGRRIGGVVTWWLLKSCTVWNTCISDVETAADFRNQHLWLHKVSDIETFNVKAPSTRCSSYSANCSFLCTWAIAGIFQPFPGVSISRSSIIVWVHHVFCGSGITNQEFARTDNKAIQSSESSGQLSDRLILAGRWFVPKSFPYKLHQFQAPNFHLECHVWL